MITFNDITDAQECLVGQWKEDGKAIIVACLYETPFNGTFNQFLNHCTAYGGNWSGLVLSGIKSLYPKVWELIPENLGKFGFVCLCNILLLLGVDTSE